MGEVLVGAAILACPIGMGVMMWFMAKGMRRDSSSKDAEPNVEELRVEHRRLGEEIEQLERPASGELSEAGR